MTDAPLDIMDMHWPKPDLDDLKVNLGLWEAIAASVRHQSEPPGPVRQDSPKFYRHYRYESTEKISGPTIQSKRAEELF